MFTFGAVFFFQAFLYAQVFVSSFYTVVFIQLAILFFLIYYHGINIFPRYDITLKLKHAFKSLHDSPVEWLCYNLLLLLSFIVLSTQSSSILGNSLQFSTGQMQFLRFKCVILVGLPITILAIWPQPWECGLSLINQRTFLGSFLTGAGVKSLMWGCEPGAMMWAQTPGNRHSESIQHREAERREGTDEEPTTRAEGREREKRKKSTVSIWISEPRHPCDQSYSSPFHNWLH